jgi:hypothetical protein
MSFAGRFIVPPETQMIRRLCHKVKRSLPSVLHSLNCRLVFGNGLAQFAKLLFLFFFVHLKGKYRISRGESF